MNSVAAVRAAVEQDTSAVLQLIGAAFGAQEGPRAAELATLLDRTGSTRASIVAEVAGVIVGHVQLSRSWLDAERALVEVLVLSPLSVAPEAQRQGVGATLLAAALLEAERQAAPAVFLEGDPTYYGGRGWRPAASLGFFKPSTRIPDAAFQVVILPGHEDWMRGALVYCDPFWALDCVGLR